MSMETRYISADIINDIIHSSLNTFNNISALGSNISSRRAHINQHRPHASTGINPTISSRIRVQYDHLVNTIRNYNSGSMVLWFVAGNRRASPSTIYPINRKINWYRQFQMNSTPTDINNHSDTHCFGQKICPVRWNDMIFSVSPFIS